MVFIGTRLIDGGIAPSSPSKKHKMKNIPKRLPTWCYSEHFRVSWSVHLQQYSIFRVQLSYGVHYLYIAHEHCSLDVLQWFHSPTTIHPLCQRPLLVLRVVRRYPILPHSTKPSGWHQWLSSTRSGHQCTIRTFWRCGATIYSQPHCRRFRPTRRREGFATANSSPIPKYFTPRAPVLLMIDIGRHGAGGNQIWVRTWTSPISLNPPSLVPAVYGNDGKIWHSTCSKGDALSKVGIVIVERSIGKRMLLRFHRSMCSRKSSTTTTCFLTYKLSFKLPKSFTYRLHTYWIFRVTVNIWYT